MWIFIGFQVFTNVYANDNTESQSEPDRSKVVIEWGNGGGAEQEHARREDDAQSEKRIQSTNRTTARLCATLGYTVEFEQEYEIVGIDDFDRNPDTLLPGISIGYGAYLAPWLALGIGLDATISKLIKQISPIGEFVFRISDLFSFALGVGPSWAAFKNDIDKAPEVPADITTYSEDPGWFGITSHLHFRFDQLWIGVVVSRNELWTGEFEAPYDDNEEIYDGVEIDTTTVSLSVGYSLKL